MRLKGLLGFTRKLVGSRWFTPVYICLILGVFVTLSLLGSAHDSVTNDEVAHIPAGISYVKTHNLSVNSEHPPLVKYLSGLSAEAITKPKMDTKMSSWQNLTEWELGRQTLYQTPGNNPDKIAFWARLPVLLLAVGLGLVIYLWTSQMLGQLAGLGALTLFACDPTMIAYSHLVTFDLPMAAFIAASAYCLWLGLNQPGRRWFIASGIMLGLALGSKVSALAFVPVIIFIVGAKIIWGRETKNLIRCLTGLLWLGLACVITIWTVYLLVERSGAWRQLAVLPRDFLNSVDFGFERFGATKPVYIAGHIYGSGQWWYFPFNFLFKSPLVLIALLLAGLAGIHKSPKSKDVLLFLVLPALLLALIAISSSLDLGIRYLFIAYPFIFLLAGYGFANIFSGFSRRWGAAMVLFVGIYYLLALASYYPNYLSYTNELVGAHETGYTVFSGSNVDWGQGLKELQAYTRVHHIKGMKVAYRQEADTQYYGFTNILSSIKVPRDFGTETLEKQALNNMSGQIAVSTTIADNIGLNAIGYKIKNHSPYAVISGSLLLYNL